MSLAGDVRRAYTEWSVQNTEWAIDTFICNFHTPTGASPEEVPVLVGIDSALFVEHELRELRERVQEVTEEAGIRSVSIVVRTTDSGIVITP